MCLVCVCACRFYYWIMSFQGRDNDMKFNVCPSDRQLALRAKWVFEHQLYFGLLYLSIEFIFDASVLQINMFLSICRYQIIREFIKSQWIVDSIWTTIHNEKKKTIQWIERMLIYFLIPIDSKVANRMEYGRNNNYVIKSNWTWCYRWSCTTKWTNRNCWAWTNRKNYRTCGKD